MKSITPPTISVVIPVYNGQKYLHRCIDSILNQSYKNLEIILIDDESTDSSGQICDEYAQLDDRIKVIHQKNKGTGPTRAFGVEIARGEYIAFVDNDDYTLPDMYATMLKAIQDNDADVCACQWNYEVETTDGKILHTWDTHGKEQIYGLHESSLEFAHFLYNHGSYLNGMVCSIWNKLFKRQLLLDIRLENGRGEEEEMNDYVYAQNCRVIVIPDEFYYWCENKSSVSHWKFAENMVHFLKVLERRQDYYKKDTYLVHETQLLYCNLFIEYFYKGQAVGLRLKDEYICMFRKMVVRLMASFYCPIKWYVRMVLFLVSPRLYQHVTKIDFCK